MNRSLRQATEGPAGAGTVPDGSQAVPAASTTDGPQTGPAASTTAGGRMPTGATAGRVGGVAALVQAATFVFGFAIYGTVIAGGDYGSLTADPAGQVAFLAGNEAVLHVWYAVIYLVFGGALVVLAPALYDRVRLRSPGLARSATLFGLIWATLMFAVGMTAIVGDRMVVELARTSPGQAAALWATVRLVIEGMGGGIELVGGLWMGLISLAALRCHTLPTGICWTGIAGGVAGVASTALVAPDVVVSVFGLASIVWFTWLGVHLVRGGRPAVG